MSGGPSKEPACLGVDYSGKFFNPNSSAGDYNVTYQPDEDVQIAWFGGKKTPGAVLHVTLFLVPYDSRLNVMIIFDNQTLISDNSTTWTSEDDCGNLRFSYIWRIPYYSYDTTNTSFRFTADNGASFLKSPLFFIRPNAKSTSIATDPTTFKTSSATPTQPPPTQSSVSTIPEPIGLSIGDKAGIGTGCSVIGLLVLLGILIYIKRQRTQSSQSRQTSNGYEKPELDGKVVEKPAIEIGGVEILESDCRPKRQPAVELASD